MMKSICLLINAALLLSCVSSDHVADRYRDRIQPTGVASRETTIFFLIDGLAVPTLETAIQKGTVGSLREYFSPGAGWDHLRLGRAVFPSLTYPNIASILTARDVGRHPITGNVIRDGDGTVDFQDPRGWRRLNQLLRGKTVFSALKARGATSVSLSYPFSGDTTAHESEDIDAAASYVDHEYRKIDEATLASLEKLLETSEPSVWPRFLFVHLISVDSISHEFGPEDARVQEQLALLARELAPVFAKLRQAEAAGHEIKAILTADHGFVSTRHRVPIEDVIAKLEKKLGPGLEVLPDNRIASIRVPKSWRAADRETAASTLTELPHVEWAAARIGSRLEVYHRVSQGVRHARLEWHQGTDCTQARWTWLESAQTAEFHCLADYDRDASFANENHVVTGLSEYFANPTAPDLIVVPDATSDYSGHYLGNHGGLTPQEIFVPLLTHRVEVGPGPVPTATLLRELSY